LTFVRQTIILSWNYENMASPVTIELPNEALPDLIKIASLGEGVFDSLLTALKETPPTLRGWQFSNNVADRVPAIERSDVGSLLGAIVSLYVVRRRPDKHLSAQQVAEGILQSPLVSEATEFTDQLKRTLNDRIVKLLGCDNSVGVTSKAFDVMTEHERIYCHARILSDIRPVFADAPEKPNGAVIIHNLQMGFMLGGEHQEIYLAMDINDLRQLKLVIERAEIKDGALQSIVRQSSIPYLAP